MPVPDPSDERLLADAAARAQALLGVLERDGTELAGDPTWAEGAVLYARAAEAARRVLAELGLPGGPGPVPPTLKTESSK